MRPMAFLSHRPTVQVSAILSLAALLCLTAVTWASDSPENRASLKGIQAVQVVVEQIKPDAEQDGLTRSDLQADVELRLRQAGIPVGPSSAAAGLIVNVNTTKASGMYSVNILVEVIQSVTLERTPSIRLVAPTWSMTTVGLAGASHLREVRSIAAQIVDKFIDAYLEQNPKK